MISGDALTGYASRRFAGNSNARIYENQFTGRGNALPCPARAGGAKLGRARQCLVIHCRATQSWAMLGDARQGLMKSILSQSSPLLCCAPFGVATQGEARIYEINLQNVASLGGARQSGAMLSLVRRRKARQGFMKSIYRAPLSSAGQSKAGRSSPWQGVVWSGVP